MQMESLGISDTYFGCDYKPYDDELCRVQELGTISVDADKHRNLLGLQTSAATDAFAGPYNDSAGRMRLRALSLRICTEHRSPILGRN